MVERETERQRGRDTEREEREREREVRVGIKKTYGLGRVHQLSTCMRGLHIKSRMRSLLATPSGEQ